MLKNLARKTKLPMSIWALGLVSLFMDISSEIVHGLLPVFLVTALGASITSIGILEGVAEATVLVMKVFSGPISDLLRKRKPLVVIGYLMGALSKPFFAMAGSVATVFAARTFDRMGKGIRGAPRDALIADITPPNLRGRAFGLRQSLDTVGAVLGPLLAILLMFLTKDDYRIVFWIATIPGLMAVGILVYGVQEQTNKNDPRKARVPFNLKYLGTFKSSFWLVVGAGAIFQLSRFSEAFLILRATNLGLKLALIPTILVVMNVVYSLSAYPIGYLSDRVRREWFLLIGLVILCLSQLLLGFATGLALTYLGVVLWGLHLGLTQGTLAALVSDNCDSDRRGTAYGIFNFFSAIALLMASVIAGVLWEKFGPNATFFAGAMFSLISIFAFFIAGTFWRKPASSL